MNVSTLTQREEPERHELPASLEALPSPVPRPVQWQRLRENLAILRGGDTTKLLDAAYSVGDSIGGMSDERHLRRMWRSKAGRDLLAARPSLAEALSDHSALAALPDESLGHYFLSFAVRHGIDSMALLESQHAMSRDYLELDPVRQWLSDRLTVMHDLWHVLAGYDATTSGESALMCFSLPQRVNDRALPIFHRDLDRHGPDRDKRCGARNSTWHADEVPARTTAGRVSSATPRPGAQSTRHHPTSSVSRTDETPRYVDPGHRRSRLTAHWVRRAVSRSETAL